MKIMDKAVIGMGEAEGHGCIVETAEAAIADPSIGGARCVLINVTGAPDMTLFGIDGRGPRSFPIRSALATEIFLEP